MIVRVGVRNRKARPHPAPNVQYMTLAERVRHFAAANAVIFVVRRLWPYLRHEWRRMLIAAGITLLLTTVEVATPVLIGMFVDMILSIQMGATPPSWPHYTIILLLAIGAFSRGHLIARQLGLTGEIGERVAARMRNALWAHLQQLPLDFLRRRGPGRLSMRFISDTRSIQRLVTQGMVRLSQDLLLGLAVLVALLVLNWRMALAIAVVLPIYGAIFRRINPELRKASRSARRRRSRMSAYLNERINGMVAIKSSVRQNDEMQRFRKLTRNLSNRGAQVAAVGGRMEGMAAAAVAGSGVLMLALAAGEAAAGRLTGGALVTFYTLLGLLVPVFQRIALANRYFQEAHISIEYFTSVMEEQPEAPEVDTRPALAVTSGYLSVEDVSFRYGKGKQALSHVRLEARRGEVVALVGANGAGKSTLLDLLLCFRKPTGGRISIDDQDITEVSLASLRSQIGLVDQNALLFDGTIAQNIAYGVQNGVPEEHIQRAAKLAGVDNIVAALPKGWDTPVGAGGQSLSGGQRQRIALARALAADPPFLVLDEATSAVDAETEQALTEMLRRLAHNKTIIVAAHRLPTLMVADKIYVLEAGRVVEEGTHLSLLRRGGVYTRLFGEARGVRPGQLKEIDEVSQWTDEVFHL